MSKIKVGDITIENGSISYSQSMTVNNGSMSFTQSSSSQQIQHSASSHTTIPNATAPVQKNNGDTLLNQLPSNKWLYVGGGFASIVVGVIALPFSFIGVPFVGTGIGLLVLGLIKTLQTNKQKSLTDKKDAEMGKENEQTLLNFFEQNNKNWMFEELEKNNVLPVEPLLLTLKVLVDDGQVIEDMNEETGEWFYHLNNEHKKESDQPLSLENRLKNMRS